MAKVYSWSAFLSKCVLRKSSLTIMYDIPDVVDENIDILVRYEFFCTAPVRMLANQG